MIGIRVLIADDNQVDRMLLSTLVRSLGAEIHAVNNGEQAVEAVVTFKPDIILMDVMMPVMGGRQAARMIRAMSGDDFIPVIFLTSLTDASSLVECLESGGDDFLSKPYDAIIIAAKMRSFSRMRVMHQTLQNQRDTIVEHNQYMLREQHVAKSVFDNVAHSGCLSADHIRYLLSPLSVFNGDVLLAAYSPSGDMYVILGDFTGHGLAAAIGSLPLSEVFYRMTERGFPLRDIIREINKRLKQILPVGFFCCAAVAEMKFLKKSINVWMGGIPDCYLLRTNGEFEVLTSNRLPLGVVSDAIFNDHFQLLSMDIGDRLYMYSDGLVEATNSDGEMFGYERLREVFLECDMHTNVFTGIQKALDNFIGSSEHTDDVTLIEITMPTKAPIDVKNTISDIGPLTWSMTYRLEADSLRQFDPHSLLIDIISEVPALRVLSSQIRMVLTEIYVNALEHGVLGLSSDLKSSSSGFSQYYQQRADRLKALSYGFIEIRLRHKSGSDSGVLTIEVEDSGAGFDYQNRKNQLGTTNIYSGRGLDLVQQISSSLSYYGRGNIVRSVIAWPQS